VALLAALITAIVDVPVDCDAFLPKHGFNTLVPRLHPFSDHDSLSHDHPFLDDELFLENRDRDGAVGKELDLT
jgi:hypothetical protein